MSSDQVIVKESIPKRPKLGKYALDKFKIMKWQLTVVEHIGWWEIRKETREYSAVYQPGNSRERVTFRVQRNERG